MFTKRDGKWFARFRDLLAFVADLGGATTFLFAAGAALVVAALAVWRWLGKVPAVILFPLSVGIFFVVLALILWISYQLLGSDPSSSEETEPSPADGGARRANHQFQFANVNTVLERESQARVIWVISPRLFYDVYNPEFRRVIAANKARNAVYRYIVPNSRKVRQNLHTYREIYKETEEQEREQFLTLPDSKFTVFLTEIAIYDPGEPTMYAFSAPPAPHSTREDVMVLDRDTSQDYAKKFSDIWLAQKKRLP